MLDSELTDRLAEPVKVLQIIVTAMVTGVVLFLGVATQLRLSGQMADQPNGTGSLVTYIATGYGVAAVLVRTVLASVIVTAGRRKILQQVAQSDDDAMSRDEDVVDGLVSLFRVRTIVAAAVLEGSALFLVVAYMIEGESLAMIAAVLLVLFLACHFPTRGRAADWIDRERRRIEQERLSAR